MLLLPTAYCALPTSWRCNDARYLNVVDGVFCEVKVLLASAVLLFAGIPARAGPGLDLAILVDRSQSMSACPRIERTMVNLSAGLLARNSAMYDMNHRLAVISFASAATVDMPWTSVRDETLRITPRHRGGTTDVLAGLRQAKSLFDTLPRDSERRHAVIIVTDGVPYVRDADARHYIEELDRYVDAHMTRAGISVDVVAIAPHAMEWKPSVLHATTATAADILATLHAVITRLAGTESVESAPSKSRPGVDHIVVPPYLDLIVFDAFRTPSSAKIEIFPPHSDRAMSETADGVEAVSLGDALQTFAVSRPAPGEWTIRKSHPDAHVRIRSQQFFPRGVLLEPNRTTAARNDVRVVYQVLGDDALPLGELPEYPLSLDVTLAAPDGRKHSMALERDASSGRAVFRAGEDALCTALGHYWTDVRVHTADASGNRVEVFRDRWAGFTVTAGRTDVEANAMTAPPQGRRTLGWLTGMIALVFAIALAISRLRKT
jgi:Mg-chelatase subunit ChlD